jgi:hypothetical protein
MLVLALHCCQPLAPSAAAAALARHTSAKAAEPAAAAAAWLRHHMRHWPESPLCTVQLAGCMGHSS